MIDAIRMRPTHANMRQPGFGVGGYCLTKDPLFAKIAAKEILNLNGHEFPFSSQAVQVNDEMPLVTLKKLKNHFKGDLNGINILLMGVTYRQDVGDTRFSPSEIFVEKARLQGAKINAHDPLIDHWDEVDLEIKTELPNSVSSSGSGTEVNYQPLLDEHILDRLELAILSCEISNLTADRLKKE